MPVVSTAWGATLVWEATATGERLSLSFDLVLPQNDPKKIGEDQVLIPIAWSFWQRERRPRMPENLPQSALFQGFERSQQGLEFAFEPPFTMNSTRDTRAKKMVIEIQNLRPPQPEISEEDNVSTVNERAGSEEDSNTNETIASNATESLWAQDKVQITLPEPMASPPVPVLDKPISRRIAPGQILRNQIIWPELVAEIVQDEPDQKESGAVAALEQPDLSSQNTTMALDAVSSDQPGNLTQELNFTPISAALEELNQRNASELTTAEHESKVSSEALPGSEDTAGNALADSDFSTPANASLVSKEDAQENLSAAVEEQLALAQAALADQKLGLSREILQRLVVSPDLSDDLREELLYMMADIRMQEGQKDVPSHFTTILQAYEEAKNFNPKSKRLPEVLAKIGHLHLQVGNTPEAKAHFDYLRRAFPDDAHVPLVDYYWGEYFASQGAYQQASDHFQYVLQNYPHNDVAQPSAIGLLKSMSELGFNDRAYALVREIEEQWPDSGVEYPPFLMSAGYAALMMDALNEAKEYFWHYYNLVPSSADADVALVRIGDIFIKTGNYAAARDVFWKTITDFPIREGGLIAQMRLAEEGLLDSRDSTDRSALRRTELDPEMVYTQILDKTQGDLAPVARLKLAILHLRNKEYARALVEAARFEQDYPQHDFLPKNREVQDKALTDWILTALDQGQFEEVLQAWASYGEELFRDKAMDPELRLAVATAMLESKKWDQGLDMLGPLIFDPPRSPLAEQGLDLFLALQVEAKNWPEVVRATQEAVTWNLPEAKQRVLDYTAALAHENLDDHNASRALWTKLSTNLNLPEDQRGYALYFLARDAMAREDVEQAGILAQEALALLVKGKTDIPKIKDCLEMLIRAAEAAGRDEEALSWILQVEEYMDEKDASWAAFIYRKALLYKKLGEQTKWRATAQQLIEAKPDDLYSRMAASELEAQRLEQAIQKLR